MSINIATWLAVALVISVTVNVFLFWYLRKVINKLLFVSENLRDLVEIINNYKKNLGDVYKLEMFYGDQTLEFLMQHTNGLIDILKDYEDVYSIAVPIEIEGDTDFDNREDEPTEEEKIPQQIDKENVLYAGARRRDNYIHVDNR